MSATLGLIVGFVLMAAPPVRMDASCDLVSKIIAVNYAPDDRWLFIDWRDAVDRGGIPVVVVSEVDGVGERIVGCVPPKFQLLTRSKALSTENPFNLYIELQLRGTASNVEYDLRLMPNTSRAAVSLIMSGNSDGRAWKAAGGWVAVRYEYGPPRKRSKQDEGDETKKARDLLQRMIGSGNDGGSP